MREWEKVEGREMRWGFFASRASDSWGYGCGERVGQSDEG